MAQNQATKLRAKILGVLLRDARIASGKSMKELGEVIGVSSGTISSAERGLNSLSLPELELLSFFLDRPVEHFWTEKVISEEPHPSKSIEADRLLSLRHKTIGAMLRQARTERNLSQKDVAQRTGISSSRIRRYENGETAVPLPELEQLAEVLDYSAEAFADNSGPVGEWMTRQRASQAINDLPRNLQEFIADPANRTYLDLAQKLSTISIEKLRSLADGLTDLIN